MSGVLFVLHCSFLRANICQSLKLGPETVQEVQVVVLAVVTAASDGACGGARPLEPVAADDVIGIAAVLLRSQEGHFLEGRGRKALYLSLCGRSLQPRAAAH